jgi:O-antigen ligase
VVGILVTIVLATGIGERIFGHLFIDNSATVRARIWQVFNYMTVDDVIFGLSPTEISTIAYRLSLIYPLETIENFWLVMLMQMGVVGFIPFVLGLFQANLYFWRRISGPARIGLVLFFIVASSNNSLTAKVSSLTILYTALTGLSAYLRVKADATPNCPAHIGQAHR